MSAPSPKSNLQQKPLGLHEVNWVSRMLLSVARPAKQLNVLFGVFAAARQRLNVVNLVPNKAGKA